MSFIHTVRKKNILIIVSVIVALVTGAAATVWYHQAQTREPIFAYNKQRDYQDIVDLFELERFWLTATVDYSPYYMLDFMAPNKKPAYRGTLHINVLRPDNVFAGFTAYYMHDKSIGMILFLAVRPEMRSRGYGKILIKSAIGGLKKLGAKKINLVTRTTNIPGQKVYTALGFDEILRDEEGFVYYEYTK